MSIVQCNHSSLRGRLLPWAPNPHPTPVTAHHGLRRMVRCGAAPPYAAEPAVRSEVVS